MNIIYPYIIRYYITRYKIIIKRNSCHILLRSEKWIVYNNNLYLTKYLQIKLFIIHISYNKLTFWRNTLLWAWENKISLNEKISNEMYDEVVNINILILLFCTDMYRADKYRLTCIGGTSFSYTNYLIVLLNHSSKKMKQTSVINSVLN